MEYLYGGTILRINLTKEEIVKEATAKYSDKYIGGRGVNARILFEEVGKDVEPLSPDNIIAFGVGPLTGTMFPGSSRVDTMTRSPVTRLIGNSNFGGDFGAELKYAGYDNIIIKGKAENPVYIYIENDNVEIRDAQFLWGKTVWEMTKMLRKTLNDEECKVVGIGPAGENQVVYASLQTNVGNSGARSGLGCVLGSKNVKAVAVRGTKGVNIANSEEFFKVCMNAHDTIKNAEYYEEVKEIGVTAAECSYVLSGLEYSGDSHETAPNFDPDKKTDFTKFWDKYKFGRTGCFGCPVQCMENYNVPNLGGCVISCELYPQFNWKLRNTDMMLFYEATKTCQQYGIDSISVSTVIQWLMVLYEKGILTSNITDGIEMKYGDRQAILGMLMKTINRDGFGSIMADGIDAIANYLDERIPQKKRENKSTKYWAMQVNNNPMLGINPQFPGAALGFAVGRRSDPFTEMDMWGMYVACLPEYPNLSEEEKKEFDEAVRKDAEEITGEKEAGDPYSCKGKAGLVVNMTWPTMLADTMVTCKWHTKWLMLDITPEHYARALSAGLGKEISVNTLLEAAKRIKSLERAYENYLGRTKESDTLPEKEFDPNTVVNRGPWKGLSLDRKNFEKMRDEYYDIVGWDKKTGIVRRETLKETGLDDILQKLEKEKLYGDQLAKSQKA